MCFNLLKIYNNGQRNVENVFSKINIGPTIFNIFENLTCHFFLKQPVCDCKQHVGNDNRLVKINFLLQVSE